MNRRVGWQAASLGAAKRIQAAKLARIRATDAPQLAGGLFTSLAIFLIGVGIITASQKIWGALSLMAAILIVVFQLVPWPWSGGAIPQLLSVLSWSLWTIAFGVRLLMKPKSASI